MFRLRQVPNAILPSDKIAEMAKHGFRVVTSADFLTGDDRVKDGERAIITFEGSELVRPGGGPRCMTLPVHREDPWD